MFMLSWALDEEQSQKEKQRVLAVSSIYTKLSFLKNV